MFYFLSIIIKASRKHSNHCNYYLYQFLYGYFMILHFCNIAIEHQKLWADMETFDWIKASFVLSDRTFPVKTSAFYKLLLKKHEDVKAENTL